MTCVAEDRRRVHDVHRHLAPEVNIDFPEAIARYQAGWPLTRLATAYQCTAETVRLALRAHGVKLRPRRPGILGSGGSSIGAGAIRLDNRRYERQSVAGLIAQMGRYAVSADERTALLGD